MKSWRKDCGKVRMGYAFHHDDGGEYGGRREKGSHCLFTGEESQVTDGGVSGEFVGMRDMVVNIGSGQGIFLIMMMLASGEDCECV